MYKSIASSVVLALCLTFAAVITPNVQAGIFDKYPTPPMQEGMVAIPVNTVDDGQAHYFQMKAGGKTIRFFVVKGTDEVMRAAFDACDVCYESRKGYYQDGEFMVCRNCGQRFHINRINQVKGGCNPSPLHREEQNGLLLITLEDIAAGAFYF